MDKIRYLLSHLILKLRLNGTHIYTIIFLFLCDIIAVLCDLSGFIMLAPEALPTIIVFALIIYIYRKLSLSQKYSIATKINVLICSIALWSCTLIWVGPSYVKR